MKKNAGAVQFALYTLSAVLVTSGLIFAYHQFDQFLIRDARFVLSSDGDLESDALQLQGVRHASRERIQQVFSRDRGRSIYLFPLAERRRNLLAVDWVKDATVSRIWPNRVGVLVTERQPVAFLHPASAESEQLLVDEDGVLLPAVEGARFRLPVVTGLSRALPEEDRRLRVRRMLKLKAEIGAHLDRVSEIDLGNAEDLRITYPWREKAMVLHLGYRQYARRLKRFLDNAEEIERRVPSAREFDLRVDGQVTVVRDGKTVTAKEQNGA